MDKLKIIESKNYNSIFNSETGAFMRWGSTLRDDPEFSPFGPEIIDCEVSTVCHQGCQECYKSNTSKGENMSLATWKAVLGIVTNKKTPDQQIPLQQVAFGIGDIDGNPDLWDIMQHTRDSGYVPNITINGYRMTDEYYEKLAMICGAVSISNYNKDVCYGAVERLNQEKKKNGATLRQVNIHQILSEESLDQCWGLLQDMIHDERLKELGASVFLSLKPKGNRNSSTPLKSMSKYKKLIDCALDNNLKIGFDSCGCNNFQKAIQGRKEEKFFNMFAEPCESTCFSLYVNSKAEIAPCSFCEGENGMEPINLLETEDFVEDVWNDKLSSFRSRLLENNRKCPVFDIEMEE